MTIQICIRYEENKRDLVKLISEGKIKPELVEKHFVRCYITRDIIDGEMYKLSIPGLVDGNQTISHYYLSKDAYAWARSTIVFEDQNSPYPIKYQYLSKN
jgi:hypothetical protein